MRSYGFPGIDVDVDEMKNHRSRSTHINAISFTSPSGVE